jgi:hypothetical protein
LGTLNPEIPLELEQICARAMSKRPENRYPTCHELAAALRNWLVSATANDVTELAPTPWLNLHLPTTSEVANSETQTYVNPTKDSAPLEHQKRRFFRFASPMCLVGTLILFMLPCVDVGCYPRQFSGSDLAFGGWSEIKNVAGQVVRQDLIGPRIRITMIVFTCILIAGIVAGFAMAGPHLMPSIRRATVVGSVGLLCILLPLSLTLTYKEFIVSECRFTLWYYLSYVTSAGSVLLSVREAKIILSKQVAVSQTVPGWVLCFLFGWSLLVVAWFLPVIAVSRSEGDPRAIEVALVASYRGFLRWPPIADRTGFQKFLILLSLLSNVVILASFAIRATSSRRTLFIYASILAGCALLNTQWLFYGVILTILGSLVLLSLSLGYYFWLASFIVLAGAVFFRARHQGDGSVSTRELFARAVPVFFLMNLGIFAVLGMLWFVIK